MQITIDTRQIENYNGLINNERGFNMKTCQTCGKILRSSMEEFRVNGIVQCESCAYSKDPIKISEAQETAKQSSDNEISSSWIGSLKLIAKINIIVGIIASFAIGILVYNLIYGDGAFIFAAITVIVGIVLSLLCNALLMVFAEMAEDVSIIRHIMSKK